MVWFLSPQFGSTFLGHCLTHIVQHTVREGSSFEASLLLCPHFVREVKTTNPKSCQAWGLKLLSLIGRSKRYSRLELIRNQ